MVLGFSSRSVDCLWSQTVTQSWMGNPCNQGRSQDFSKGGSPCAKVGYSPDCHYGQGIVMGFSPPVVGCLIKKGVQKGALRAPQDPPGYALACNRPQCLENGPPQGRYRLWRKAAARLWTEAIGPEGEETWTKYCCRMPSVWPHLCVQPRAACSPTASLAHSSLAPDGLQWPESQIFRAQNKSKVKYNSK